VLLNEPSTFRRYGLSSPSMWRDRGSLFGFEATYARTHNDLSAEVMIGVGELESPAGAAGQVELLPEEERAGARARTATDCIDRVAGARLLVDALQSRGYPNIRVELQVQPGEGHLTVAPLNLSRALRSFWPVPV
jgi:predicted alpha/beta superfamily hydrolase